MSLEKVAEQRNFLILHGMMLLMHNTLVFARHN